MSGTALKIPAHVAIIMDGNGRWAEARGLPRIEGHRRGAQAVDRITEECARLGVARLTLYAFSRENWRRPEKEVTLLMALLREYLERYREKLLRNEIRLTAIGRLEDLPADTRAVLDRVIADTAGGARMNLCLALSYGGRTEIVDAARALARKVRDGDLTPEEITEDRFAEHLYQPGPDPDLVIRTAGEMRLSNFLLWEASYAEFYSTPLCWPEFDEAALMEAIRAFNTRVRKFGGLVNRNGGGSEC